MVELVLFFIHLTEVLIPVWTNVFCDILDPVNVNTTESDER